jgi:haloalkane dehalogenase
LAWAGRGFHAARRYLRTKFGRIAYVERGDGPAALFLHGWPLNGFQWRGVMARLAAERRCIAADFMGLGYTDVNYAADLSPLAQSEMLIAVIDGLRLGQVDLVANDSGTAVAQLLAADYPHRIRSMVLTNGDVHTNSPPPSLRATLEEARRGLLIRRLERQIADPRLAQTDDGLGVVYTNPAFVTPELVDVYLKPLAASARRRHQCQQYGVAFEPSPLPAIEAKLRSSTIPARIVWGTGDPLFTPQWAEWLDAALPASRGIRYVAGAKLFFPEEFPDVIAEEAGSLWNRGGAA